MFRRLTVVAKVRESRTITSFHLQPANPADWCSFKPGQFLVFKFPAATGAGHVLRNYSVSSSPLQVGSYRITVKREGAPNAELPDGLSSCYLHDHVNVGDELLAEGPRGQFHLDCASARPVVLLSGGVGLTPLVSMFHSLARDTDRRVYFIHACDNGEVQALGDEVRELANLRTGLTLHACYRYPTEADITAKRYDSEGIVTAELLQDVLPLDDYDVYLCGPPPFMQGVYLTLLELGVAKQRIAYEFFGPAAVLDTERNDSSPRAPVRTTPANEAAQAITVEFRKSGLTAAWEDSISLLDFAEKQGLKPDFSCRAGICGSCKSTLLEGDVDYFEEPLDEVEEGSVLICSCKPKSSIVVDL